MKDLYKAYGDYQHLCGTCKHFKSDKYSAFCEIKKAVVTKNYSCRDYTEKKR